MAQATQKSSLFQLLGGSGMRGNQLVQEDILQAAEISLHEGLNIADIIIDFSTVEGNGKLLKEVERLKGKTILIATTGLQESQINSWLALGNENHRIMIAANTSLGIILTLSLSKQLASVLYRQGFDIEILESHHKYKVDAPSGSALLLAQGIADQEGLEVAFARKGKRSPQEIGISSLRGGSIFGEHRVHFFGEQEEICITHTALSRTLFAEGALVLATWLHKRQVTGTYHIQDVDIEDLTGQA